MGIYFNKLSSSDNNRPQRRRQTVSRQDVASLQDGEELYETLGDDPAAMEVIRNSTLHVVSMSDILNV